MLGESVGTWSRCAWSALTSRCPQLCKTKTKKRILKIFEWPPKKIFCFFFCPRNSLSGTECMEKQPHNLALNRDGVLTVQPVQNVRHRNHVHELRSTKKQSFIIYSCIKKCLIFKKNYFMFVYSCSPWWSGYSKILFSTPPHLDEADFQKKIFFCLVLLTLMKRCPCRVLSSRKAASRTPSCLSLVPRFAKISNDRWVAFSAAGHGIRCSMPQIEKNSISMTISYRLRW